MLSGHAGLTQAMMHRWSRRRSRVGGVPDLLVATAPVNCVRIRTRGRTRPYSGGDRRTSGGVAMLAGRPGAGLTTLPEVVAHRQEQSQGGHEAEEYEGLHFRSSLPMAWRDLDRRDAEGGVRRVHSDARASCTPPGAKLVQGNFGQILGGSRPCAALASRGADEEPPEGLRTPIASTPARLHLWRRDSALWAMAVATNLRACPDSIHRLDPELPARVAGASTAPAACSALSTASRSPRADRVL